MQLRHYAWVIGRSLWLVFLLTCLIAGATYAITGFLITPVYQASALVRVNAAGDSSTVYADQAEAVTYSLLVTNSAVLQESAAQLKTISVTQLKQVVSASPLDGTSIIEIRAQASNASQAANIANTVALNFINVEETKVSAALQSNLQQLSSLLTTAKNAVAADQTQLNTLQQTHASSASIAHQTSVLEDAQSNYDNLLLNYEQTQQQLLRVNNLLTQTQKAFPPNAPVSPNARLDTAAAAGLALLLVIVFVLLRDWLDASIRTPEDVAHLSALEPAGSVPISKQPLVGTSKENDGAIEQTFMIMALSLSKQYAGRSAIVVTALRPGAGTTTTAANLAISLARLGKRVLLLDANLHRPSLHNLFQCSNQKGLVASLSEIRGLQEEEMFSWLSQWSTPTPNLWLLPASTAVAQSTAVLCSPEMQVLMHWLLGRNNSSNHSADGTGTGIMDYIIIDSPSLKEGADSITLTAFTNHTLLVVEAGKEQGESLNKAGEVFQRLGSPILGVVVNRQTVKHRPYFYIENAQQSPSFAESLPALTTTVPAETASSGGKGGGALQAREQRRSTPTTYPLPPSALIPPRPGSMSNQNF